MALATCSGNPIAPGSTVAPGGGTSTIIDTGVEWRLASIAVGGGPAATIADPALFTLALHENGRLEARADCNRASGTYTLDKNVLAVGNIAATRAYCGDESFDQRYLALLDGENVVTRAGSALQLASSRGTLSFIP